MSIELKAVVLLKLDAPTINGRVYPQHTISEAISNVDQLSGGFMDSEDNNMAVSLEKISHIARNLRVDGDRLIGDIIVLETPKGKILQELYDAGACEFAPSGFGSIGHDGVVSNYTFRSIDVVAKSA